MTERTIVVTRPAGDEQSLIDALHAGGCRAVHEPLTSIYLHHTERQALYHALTTEPDAVIVTSKHAVAALAFLSDLRDMYLICVGEATAHLAESMGFSRVHAGGGTVEKLLQIIPDVYDEDTRFLYLSGEHTRVDLEAEFTQYSMRVKRLVLYEAVASEQLSDTLIEHFKRRHIDAVTFLSQRTAQIFITLLKAAEMQEALTYMHAFCLSPTIAEALAAHPWNAIHIAQEPTLASLVECVDNVFGTDI